MLNNLSPTNSLDVLKIEFCDLVHPEDVRHICTLAPWTKTTKVVRWFLLTNRQFQEVGHCRRHIFGPILPKFYVEFENIDSSCDNLRPFRN